MVTLHCQQCSVAVLHTPESAGLQLYFGMLSFSASFLPVIQQLQHTAPEPRCGTQEVKLQQGSTALWCHRCASAAVVLTTMHPADSRVAGDGKRQPCSLYNKLYIV